MRDDVLDLAIESVGQADPVPVADRLVEEIGVEAHRRRVRSIAQVADSPRKPTASINVSAIVRRLCESGEARLTTGRTEGTTPAAAKRLGGIIDVQKVATGAPIAYHHQRATLHQRADRDRDELLVRVLTQSVEMTDARAAGLIASGSCVLLHDPLAEDLRRRVGVSRVKARALGQLDPVADPVHSCARAGEQESAWRRVQRPQQSSCKPTTLDSISLSKSDAPARLVVHAAR